MWIMKRLNIDYKLGIWAAVVVILTTTLPRLAYSAHRQHGHHGFETTILISLIGLAIFSIVPPIVEGFIYRLLPTKIVRRFSKKDSVLIVILASLAVLFGIEHNSFIRTFGHITANTLYLVVFLQRGYWSSVATNGFANLIISLSARLFSLLILP
jgi:hypothetical protein